MVSNKFNMEELRIRLKEAEEKLKIKEKKEKIASIEKESSEPSFWQNNQFSTARMKELTFLSKQVREIEEIRDLINKNDLSKAVEKLDKLEFDLYFSGPHDENGAILSIHAGQGGTEAMDWTEMLLRMYLRFIEQKGWRSEVIDQVVGDEAGLKSVTANISENLAYGYLKSEN